MSKSGLEASPQDLCKRAAAQAAAALVEEGMVVGLGTGSTAIMLVEALSKRVNAGLNCICLSTSEQTLERARELGLAIHPDYPKRTDNDLTLDGADEVGPGLSLVKGGGGALLREKLVAYGAKKLVIMVDPSKHVEAHGPGFPIPVEIVRFGWESTRDRIARMGCEAERRSAKGQPYLTDEGNYILDCTFSTVAQPMALEHELKQLTGVVEVGLFVGLADQVLTGHPDGSVTVLSR